MMQEDTVYYTPESRSRGAEVLDPRDNSASAQRAEVGPFCTASDSTAFEEVQPLARGRWISVAFILALLLIVGGSVPAGLATAYYGDFIMPGVTVLDNDLSGQSIEKATATLQNDWAARQIVLQGENHSLTVAPTTLGIQLDAAATARNARLLGREGESFAALAAVYLHGATTPPVWQIDLSATANNLGAYAYLYDVPAQDAQLTFADGSLAMVPAANGQRLDIEAMTSWLGSNSAQAVLAGEAPLMLAATEPTVTEASLQPLMERAQSWLAQPLTMRLYDPVSDETTFVEIGPEAWNQWVNLEVDLAVADPLQASVQAEKVNAYLQSGIAELGNGAYVDEAVAGEAIANLLLARLEAPVEQLISLRVFHYDRLHTVQAGETLSSIGRSYGVPYPWIQSANPAIGNNLAVGQQIVIPSVDNFLPLPVVENKRIVVSISEQKMWAYENGQLAFEWVVSTGIDSSPTSPGIFQVQSFEVDAYAGNWDLQMPHFIGIYRPVPQADFMNGFHGFPTRNGNNLLWTGDLGHPVTYGCVLVSSSNAVTLFDWAELGVVVEVLP